ncbi:ribonuclease HII [Actinomadura craniellae]|uniref:Ribonuclease HII n=1 Tax=Actinomadura craniellae TaxID=2231787 RepID=A0A365H0G8_9ACTN|nr:ribonuclease HII [Actinomadura craniellae]RAY12557.1 ribonuclease HII [Actinomadura craniellae]
MTGLRRPPRYTPRRDAGLYAYERALEHGGFTPVAGVDEAGRGACAGPMVIAAVILPAGRRDRIEGLADSKLLTPRRREEIYARIVARARAWSVVVVPSRDIDRIGLHRCNITGMRRALAALTVRPAYALSDGFRIPGLDVPGLAIPKGDQVAACVAAASVVAKVTRDRLMGELHERFPEYGFDVHKGYGTREHTAALAAHGPCAEHRFSFVNIARLQEDVTTMRKDGTPDARMRKNESGAPGDTAPHGADLVGVADPADVA